MSAPGEDYADELKALFQATNPMEELGVNQEGKICANPGTDGVRAFGQFEGSDRQQLTTHLNVIVKALIKAPDSENQAKDLNAERLAVADRNVTVREVIMDKLPALGDLFRPEAVLPDHLLHEGRGVTEEEYLQLRNQREALDPKLKGLREERDEVQGKANAGIKAIRSAPDFTTDEMNQVDRLKETIVKTKIQIKEIQDDPTGKDVNKDNLSIVKARLKEAEKGLDEMRGDPPKYTKAEKKRIVHEYKMQVLRAKINYLRHEDEFLKKLDPTGVRDSGQGATGTQFMLGFKGVTGIYKPSNEQQKSRMVKINNCIKRNALGQLRFLPRGSSAQSAAEGVSSVYRHFRIDDEEIGDEEKGYGLGASPGALYDPETGGVYMEHYENAVEKDHRDSIVEVRKARETTEHDRFSATDAVIDALADLMNLGVIDLRSDPKELRDQLEKMLADLNATNNNLETKKKAIENVLDVMDQREKIQTRLDAKAALGDPALAAKLAKVERRFDRALGACRKKGVFEADEDALKTKLRDLRKSRLRNLLKIRAVKKAIRALEKQEAAQKAYPNYGNPAHGYSERGLVAFCNTIGDDFVDGNLDFHEENWNVVVAQKKIDDVVPMDLANTHPITIPKRMKSFLFGLFHIPNPAARNMGAWRNEPVARAEVPERVRNRWKEMTTEVQLEMAKAGCREAGVLYDASIDKRNIQALQGDLDRMAVLHILASRQGSLTPKMLADYQDPRKIKKLLGENGNPELKAEDILAEVEVEAQLEVERVELEAARKQAKQTIPYLLNTIRDIFEFGTVEQNGNLLFDSKAVDESSINFMRETKLSEVVFQDTEDGKKFKVSRRGGDESFIEFSNRAPTNQELRAENLRKGIESKKQANANQTLYGAVTELLTDSVLESDIYLVLRNSLSGSQPGYVDLERLDILAKQVFEGAKSVQQAHPGDQEAIESYLDKEAKKIEEHIKALLPDG